MAAGTVYLSTAKKDRNTVTKLAKSQGYGKDYKMYGNESFLPEKLKGKKYYKT